MQGIYACGEDVLVRLVRPRPPARTMLVGTVPAGQLAKEEREAQLETVME